MRATWTLRGAGAAVVLGLLAVSGCGGGGNTVEGTVTVDGKELPDGFLSFLPVDGQGQTAGSPFKDGKYRATNVTAGKNKVEFTVANSARLDSSGGMDPKRWKEAQAKAAAAAPQLAERAQQVDVAAGQTTHDFQLKSKR